MHRTRPDLSSIPERHRLSPPGWTAYIYIYLDGILYTPHSSEPPVRPPQQLVFIEILRHACRFFFVLFSEPGRTLRGRKEILSAIKWKLWSCCWTEGKWVLTSSDLTFYSAAPSALIIIRACRPVNTKHSTAHILHPSKC